MVTSEEVKKLAQLARLSLSEEEIPRVAEQMTAIVSYVAQVSEIAQKDAVGTPEERNVFREDGEPHAPGAHTDALMDLAPKKKNGYISVPKIISYDE